MSVSLDMLPNVTAAKAAQKKQPARMVVWLTVTAAKAAQKSGSAVVVVVRGVTAAKAAQKTPCG